MKNKREKNPMAVEFGRLGGLATRKKGTDHYKQLQKLSQITIQKKKLGKVEGFALVDEVEVQNITLDEQDSERIEGVEFI